MNEKQLDNTLEAWKKQYRPKNNWFQSPREFEEAFFHKAAVASQARKASVIRAGKILLLAAVVLCIAVVSVKWFGGGSGTSRADGSQAEIVQNSQGAEKAGMDIPPVSDERVPLSIDTDLMSEEGQGGLRAYGWKAAWIAAAVLSLLVFVMMVLKIRKAALYRRRERPMSYGCYDTILSCENDCIELLTESKIENRIETLGSIDLTSSFMAPMCRCKRETQAVAASALEFDDIFSRITRSFEEDEKVVQYNTEEYKDVSEQPFLEISANPLSTFGADVDTAGYAEMRRMILQENRLPSPNAIRIEEMVNYFHYDYPSPEKDEILRPHFEMQAAPWDTSHQLLLIGVQARVIPEDELPPSHYVFLIDNSGSMESVFPMVKEAMTALATQLRDGDKVSMVTYGGGVSVIAEAETCKSAVCNKISGLHATGYTPGGAGIQTAYQLAEKHFIKDGNNRIVLITDGDFNVGTSSEAELVHMVEEKQKSGVYLTAVGCGMGNYKDNKLKMLANKGNGNYFYIDNIREAKNIFVNGMVGNMFTLAHDVKFQLEFNPGKVFAYRLLGYELRKMAATDFRNDEKDSGEVGIGQQVTALYELVPADAAEDTKNKAVPGWQPLKYVQGAVTGGDELLTFRIRYKLPQGEAPAVEKTTVLTNVPIAGDNWNWASAVAETALRMRHSAYGGDADYTRAVKRAKAALGDDHDGSRAEFLVLIHRAQDLDTK